MHRILLATTLLALACAGPTTDGPGGPSTPVGGTVSDAPQADGLVVAVLYFANNSGDDGYDALGKGLADMMVTDLARSDSVKVVEREKLQEILVELSMQQTSAFDAATAQKVGRALGASHAVTGSIAAVAPQIRLDIRLVEVETAEVLVADEVTGEATRFFDLQKELSTKFIGGLPDAGEPPEPAKGPAELQSVLEYGQALESADSGDLEGASKRLGELVRKDPDFEVAAATYEKMLKDVYAARARRDALLGGDAATLLSHADDHLDQNDVAKLGRKGAERYIGYRVVRGQVLQTKLVELATVEQDFLAGDRHDNIPPAQQAAALGLARDVADNYDQMVAELRTLHARGVEVVFLTIDDDDDKMGREIGITSPGKFAFLSEGEAERASGKLLLLGDCETFMDGVRPAPAELDKQLETRGFEQLDAALIDFEGDRYAEREIMRTHKLYGEALLHHGRKAEAIARWQLALDTYPHSGEYDSIEANIKQALGLEP